MVIHLCTGPDAKDWAPISITPSAAGSAAHRRQFNSAVIFIAGPNTRHGFDPRPITGVRCLMGINRVTGWRDRGQLAFPERPIEA